MQNLKTELKNLQHSSNNTALSKGNIFAKKNADISKIDRIVFFNLWFTPCKAEQPLRGMELQEKEAQKELNIQGISLERS